MATVGRVIDATLVVFVGAISILALGRALGPSMGYELLAVAGRSMEPAITVGDLLVIRAVDPLTIREGDVLTRRLPSGTKVTHRVVRIVEDDGRPLFVLQGDANALPDPVPAGSVEILGRLESRTPLLGFAIAMLSLPTGLAALFSIAGSLLVAGWLVDDLRREGRANRPMRAGAAPAGLDLGSAP